MTFISSQVVTSSSISGKVQFQNFFLSGMVVHTFLESQRLKVFNLNTWGLPGFSEDIQKRYDVLREILKGFDVVLLQEVWSRTYYQVIEDVLPYSTGSDDACISFFKNWHCSGLVILSKYPLENVNFIPFTQSGSGNCEECVPKGILKAQIKLEHDLTIELFNAHLTSWTEHFDNNDVRYNQTITLIEAIENSSADVKMFAGDANAAPKVEANEPYGLLTSLMTDSLTDVYGPRASWDPKFATWGHENNSYTKSDDPLRIDYIMYKVEDSRVSMKTTNFKIATYGNVSLADHEGIEAEYYIETELNCKLHAINHHIIQKKFTFSF